MKLYHYWRSSCSWRVRAALAHKGIVADMVSVSLLSGESESAEHLERNPAGFVPVLELSSGKRLTESMAICEYLEETQPVPALLPKDPLDRAYVRTLCEVINAGTQPLQNSGVQEFLSPDPDRRKAWVHHWIHTGLSVYESLISRSGTFSWGDTPTLADYFLVPQAYNAVRFEVDLSRFPRISAIHERALKLPAISSTHPDRYAPS